MNMEKPQALDARDLDTAVKETQFKAQELRRQANKLRDDAKTLEAESGDFGRRHDEASAAHGDAQRNR